MSSHTTDRAAATSQRARVATDALVSAYINEIAEPARRREHVSGPSPTAIARRPAAARRLERAPRRPLAPHAAVPVHV
jgi:hypothetical protein